MASFERGVLIASLYNAAISCSLQAQPTVSGTGAPAMETTKWLDLSSPFFWAAMSSIVALVAVGLAIVALLRLLSLLKAERQRASDAANTLSVEHEQQVTATNWKSPSLEETSPEATETKDLKELAELRKEISSLRKSEEKEREALQERQNDILKLVENFNETSKRNQQLDREELASSIHSLKSELEQVAGQQYSLQEHLGEYAPLQALQELYKQSHKVQKELTSDIERLEQIVGARTLEQEFNIWKNANLSDLAAAQAADYLAEFCDNEQNSSRLLASREQLNKLSSRVISLADAVASCSKDFEELEVGAADWEVPARRFAEFRREVLAFRDFVLDLLDKADFKQVEAATITSLSFADVVTGKSTEYFRDGYGRQLSAALDVLTNGAERATREWQGLRTDLLGVLDIVYPATPFDNFSKGARAVQAFLKKLEGVRVQEIDIREAAVSYDSTLHEPITGDRPVRPDLPENTVLKLLRRGYYVDSKVQRRALVSLSSKGIAKEIAKGVGNAVREPA